MFDSLLGTRPVKRSVPEDRLERATNSVLLYLTEPSVNRQTADSVLKKYLKDQNLNLWFEN